MNMNEEPFHIIIHEKQTRKINKQIKWWKLKKDEDRAEYQTSVTSKLDDIGLNLDWNKIQTILASTVNEKLGQTTGKGAYNEKESVWWNEYTMCYHRQRRGVQSIPER